jgi:hypothetical protein
MAQSLRYKLAPKGRLQAVQYVRGLGDLLLVKRTDGAAVLSAHLVRRCPLWVKSGHWSVR